MKINITLFLAFILAAGTVAAQNESNNWTLLTQKGGGKVMIDLKNIENSKGDDFTVWALEEHSNPIVIESVPKKIYKTKTQYLINKTLKRYGIIQLMYYDEKGNTLKHFSYLNDSQEATYKYSYPILPESTMELLLARCLETTQK
jgi:hypothetical protein